jgi:hypothetical protein
MLMRTSTSTNKFLHVDPARSSQSVATLLIFFLILLSFLGPFLGLGKILNYLIPLGSFFVAYYLYSKCQLLYIEFTIWVWFLAPLVRRLVDFGAGFTDPSPILLSPILATIPATVFIFMRLPNLYREGGLPFILAITSITYSFMVGLISHPIQSVVLDYLRWLTPITFGCYLFLFWSIYPEIKDTLKRAFFWGVLLIGGYGLYQYFFLPGWEKTWLQNMIDQLGIVTFGSPEPQAIRVWGTMNGPLIFASTMSAGLLLLLSQTKPLANLATVIGMLAFLLSQVRTAWLGLLIGLFALVTSLKQHQQIRLLIIILVLTLCIISLAISGPYADTIGERVGSFLNLSSDTSANERIETYRRVFDFYLFNFLGNGMSDGGGGDSGVLEILVKLGWLAGIFYLLGIALMLLKSMEGARLQQDIFVKTSNAIAIVLVTQLPFGGVMSNLPGVMLWGFLGIKIAACKYYAISSSENFFTIKNNSSLGLRFQPYESD